MQKNCKNATFKFFSLCKKMQNYAYRCRFSRFWVMQKNPKSIQLYIPLGFGLGQVGEVMPTEKSYQTYFWSLSLGGWLSIQEVGPSGISSTVFHLDALTVTGESRHFKKRIEQTLQLFNMLRGVPVFGSTASKRLSFLCSTYASQFSGTPHL